MYLVHARSAIHTRFSIAIYIIARVCMGRGRGVFCLIHFFHNPRRCLRELGHELMFQKIEPTQRHIR